MKFAEQACGVSYAVCLRGKIMKVELLSFAERGERVGINAQHAG
jgi:hypothetical protein